MQNIRQTLSSPDPDDGRLLKYHDQKSRCRKKQKLPHHLINAVILTTPALDLQSPMDPVGDTKTRTEEDNNEKIIPLNHPNGQKHTWIIAIPCDRTAQQVPHSQSQPTRSGDSPHPTRCPHHPPSPDKRAHPTNKELSANKLTQASDPYDRGSKKSIIRRTRTQALNPAEVTMDQKAKATSKEN